MIIGLIDFDSRLKYQNISIFSPMNAEKLNWAKNVYVKILSIIKVTGSECKRIQIYVTYTIVVTLVDRTDIERTVVGDTGY